jgi:hypothetical protein
VEDVMRTSGIAPSAFFRLRNRFDRSKAFILGAAVVLVTWTAIPISVALGQDDSSFLLGHNLTPTTYTLGQNRVTVGYYAIAYGVTDKLMIGTSPWIDLTYNMPNVDVKYGSNLDMRLVQRASAEFLYFKSYPYLRDIYRQESMLVRGTSTTRFSETSLLHLSLGLQKFWREDHPFSLRPPSQNGSSYTLSASGLVETRTTSRFGTFLEFGLIGLNYTAPYSHLGCSLYYHWNHMYIQAGMSRSAIMGELRYYGNPRNNIGWWEAVVYHQELQIQFLF